MEGIIKTDHTGPRRRRVCQHCHSRLENVKNIRRLYCGPTCRQRAHRSSVPNSYLCYVYLFRMNTPLEPVYKIGISKNLENRIRQIAGPYSIDVIHSFKCRNALEIEQDLHQRFYKKRLHGEWFNLDYDDIEYVCGLE